MLNKYMFSYFVINIQLEEAELVLGTQEGLNYWDALQRAEDKALEDYPPDQGWELKKLVMNEEAVEYVSNLTD